ncbi:uncharacterized protein LOC131874254 [Cryptomeria japonica]|uniref:uncharacterized protein LOC131874254 n=1 Tax=Cryptomeria japonica TaxID=3369 RepID=UPI0027DA7A72|nr:uncharacterized protein LOC131874254 [Cryptomeria japonica]
MYILTSTDYFTKWVEAIPTKKANSEVVCDFLKDCILVHFGVPQKIVADNASYFSSEEFTMFYYEHKITLSHSSDYFLQGNGLAESSNKNLVAIMKKLVDDNARNWHTKLYEALWADRITPKRAIGMDVDEKTERWIVEIASYKPKDVCKEINAEDFEVTKVDLGNMSRDSDNRVFNVTTKKIFTRSEKDRQEKKEPK